MTYIYENLDVWQKAMQFAGDVIESMSMMIHENEHAGILEKTEESAASIPSAIAMGKSYPSKHDFARHLYRSRGALYGAMTLMELLKRKHLIAEDIFADFDARANQLAAMLSALIKSIYAPKPDNGRQSS